MKTIACRLAVAGLIATAAVAAAQTPTPPTTPVPAPFTPGTATPATPATPADATPVTYRAKEVLGTRVLVSATQAVGVVDDIVFDDAGSIEYLIVAENGKLVTVPWAAAKFDLKAKTAVLSISPDQYRAIPTYTVTTYPTFYAPAYRTETYRAYGLTPGQLRRALRR